MYNGVGLQTARGSGTNGYVQANRARLQMPKNRVAYNSEDDIKRVDARLFKKPNPEILEYMKKREIELKCANFEVLMENKGFHEDEIKKKVDEYRELLKRQLEAGTFESECSGKDNNSHTRAKAAAETRDRLRAAFSISESFVDGSSLEK
uniref:Cwf21 domain-containing protein n=1 Tax=Syphacia muris TaxID=451379 RepID=A0A0N5AJ86_9BILA